MSEAEVKPENTTEEQAPAPETPATEQPVPAEDHEELPTPEEVVPEEEEELSLPVEVEDDTEGQKQSALAVMRVIADQHIDEEVLDNASKDKTADSIMKAGSTTSNFLAKGSHAISDRLHKYVPFFPLLYLLIL